MKSKTYSLLIVTTLFCLIVCNIIAKEKDIDPKDTIKSRKEADLYPRTFKKEKDIYEHIYFNKKNIQTIKTNNYAYVLIFKERGSGMVYTKILLYEKQAKFQKWVLQFANILNERRLKTEVKGDTLQIKTENDEVIFSINLLVLSKVNKSFE